MRSEFKILVLGLIFEYAFFQTFWNKYISDLLFNWDNINLYGIISLTCLFILTFYIILHYIKKTSVKKVFVFSLIGLFVLSCSGLLIDKNYTHKIHPTGFNTHQMYFSGFWILEEFEKDVIECKAKGYEFYRCFDDLNVKPWRFPDFYKYLLFFIGAIMTALVFGVGYCSYLLYKTSHIGTSDNPTPS